MPPESQSQNSDQVTQTTNTNQPISVPTSSSTQNRPASKNKIVLLIKIIVAAIIVAGIIFAAIAFNKSQQAKKRDEKRKTDIAAIKVALDKVSKDTKDQKYYPVALTSFLMEQRGYISKIPTDPINKEPYQYLYRGLPSGCVIDCTGYILTACLESVTDKSGQEPQTPCKTKTYQVKVEPK